MNIWIFLGLTLLSVVVVWVAWCCLFGYIMGGIAGSIAASSGGKPGEPK